MEDARSAIELLCRIESRISDVSPADLFGLYEALHTEASRAIAVDAFYVCLYAHREQRLFFPYNFDGQLYDGPVNLPLGNGPTSWVIRHQRTFVLAPQTREIQNGGIDFGDVERISQSAIHAPIRKAADAPLLGVLSTQSYEAGAYGAEAVAFVEWLAQRAAALLGRQSETEEMIRRVAEAERTAADRWSQMLAASDALVQRLQEIGDQAAEIRTLAGDGPERLRLAVRSLMQTCHRAQTEASQFPLQSNGSSAFSSVAATDTSVISALSEREREVLALLAAGWENGQIADELFISQNTVKFHCRNIFKKLGVDGRHQAARLFTMTGAGPTR